MIAAATGDTLLLQPGTYNVTNSILVKNGVTVTSVAGAWNTIVDMGWNFGSVFYINNLPIAPTIRGLTIARGVQIYDGGGGGIFVSGSSPLIEQNVILANAAGNTEGSGGEGSGIVMYGGAPVVRHNMIVANGADFGAISLEGTAALVEHNVIAYNSRDGYPLAGYGFGICCAQSPQSTVRENLLWSNETADSCAWCNVQAAFAANVHLDPLFCGPAQGVRQGWLGNWHVSTFSPLAPGGLCAGWGVSEGTVTCGLTPAASTSWGKVKATYR